MSLISCISFLLPAKRYHSPHLHGGLGENWLRNYLEDPIVVELKLSSLSWVAPTQQHISLLLIASSHPICIYCAPCWMWKSMWVGAQQIYEGGCCLSICLHRVIWLELGSHHQSHICWNTFNSAQCSEPLLDSLDVLNKKLARWNDIRCKLLFIRESVAARF